MHDRKQLKTSYDLALPGYDAMLQEIYSSVRKLLEKNGFTPTIKYRVKRFDTYHEKLRRNGTPNKKKQGTLITDMIGLRIICPFLEDIETVEKLLSTNLDVVENEQKGQQHSFREFGYDSVHLGIRYPSDRIENPLPGTSNICEVQLRTILQDAWAEVEHELVYKSDISLPNESIRRKLASLNATLTLSDLIFQEIRDYQKEIRQRGQRRRASVEKTLGLFDIIAISHPSAPLSEAPTQLRPIPTTLASSLEKTMLLALEAHSNEDLETAIDLYGQLLGMQLDQRIRALVYNHRGMAHFTLGDYRQAVRDFTKAIDYDSQNARSFANRGLCHRVLEKFSSSLADFNSALNIDPSRADAYFGRAQTFFDMQLYPKALADCERTLEIDPDFRSARQLHRLILKHTN